MVFLFGLVAENDFVLFGSLFIGSLIVADERFLHKLLALMRAESSHLENLLYFPEKNNTTVGITKPEETLKF